MVGEVFKTIEMNVSLGRLNKIDLSLASSAS